MSRVLLVLSLFWAALGNMAFAQDASLISNDTVVEATELSEPICRDQAKEIAKKRYNLCMKLVKQAEMKRLHEEYKQRIESLKSEYEREIQKMKEEQQGDEETSERAPRENRSRENTPKAVAGVTDADQ